MAVASLLVNVLLARVLTPAEMGTYFLIASIVGITSTISMFGLGLTVVNQVSNLLGSNHNDKASAYARKVLIVGSVGATVGALFFVLPSGSWLTETLINSHALLAVLGLVATQIFVQTLLSLTAEVFRSFHEIRFASLFTGASVMVTFTASLVLLVLWNIPTNLATVLEIQLGWLILSLVCALWLLRPHLKGGENVSSFDVINNAAPLFLVSLSWLAYRLDLIFVQSYQGAEDVAIYGAASKLVLTMAIPLELVNAFVTPIIGELWAQGEVKRLENMLRGITALVCIPALLIVCAFVIFPANILHFVYGDHYMGGANILAILSIGQLVNITTGSVAWTLVMTQNERLLLKINIVFGLLVAFASWWAVHFFGMLGLAVTVTLIFSLHNIAHTVALKLKTGIFLIPDPRSVKYSLGGTSLVNYEWRKPDFFIIGAPKCGTTSLAKYLGEHSNIYMSEPKEPNFFSSDLVHAGIHSLKDYAKCFPSSQEDYWAVGEASTSYLYSSMALHDILKFNPAAKFIVMIRNPIDLVYSYHSEIVAGGNENVLDFNQAWELQEERACGRHIPFGCITPSALQYKTIGSIGTRLEYVISVVGREKLHIIVMDDMRLDMAKVYRDTLKFLGIPNDQRVIFPSYNESKVVSNMTLVKLIHLMRLIRHRLSLPRVNGRVANLLGNLGLTNQVRRPMTPELRLKLIKEFRPEVEKISELLNRDMSNWLNSESN